MNNEFLRFTGVLLKLADVKYNKDKPPSARIVFHFMTFTQ